MINQKILKIASYTNNEGLKNKFTHKSFVKNSLCGDFIKTEFIANKLKIKSMRYETESCILCCLLYTSPSPRDGLLSRMPSSA